MFFDDWFGLIRILIVGVLAYASLVVCLLVSGKRTLSKWNAFDFVVTIALGSTLASVIVSRDVVLIEGVVAFALLIGLQFVITRLSVRFDFKLRRASAFFIFTKPSARNSGRRCDCGR